MTLEPLLNASLPVQIHVLPVVPAAIIGAFLLARPKGTPLHRLLGKLWLVLMVVTSASTFFVHEIRLVGPFSPIHLLSVFVLYGAFSVYRAARQGRIATHRRIVLQLYIGGIVIAGGFTFVPGRIMNTAVFSGSAVSTIAFFLVIAAFAVWAALPSINAASGTHE